MTSRSRVDRHTFTSDVLRDNPLGDPHERPLWVQVPPGYDDEPDRRYPSIYVIMGYTGQVAMWDNVNSYRATLPEALDELFSRPDVPPAIIVYADSWTKFGGSQFVNSPGTGQYHTNLVDEIVPWVDDHYRTLDAPEHRGITGKSSGGFGALITPMLRPDLFGGLASHAGDSLYEACYLPEFPKVVRALRDHYDGSIDAWLEDFFGGSRPAMTKAGDEDILITYGVAACFSADEDGTVHLPFDTRTGKLDEEVWAKWMAWDPVRMVAQHADAMRSQRAIWIDGGTRDEWFLELGGLAVVHELEAIGVTDVHYETFDAGHGNINWRYPLAIEYLARRLAPA